MIGVFQSKKGPVVYLFFDGFDLKARKGVWGGVFSRAHYLARTAKRTWCREQVHTGFYVAFVSLCESLRLLGCDVRINDFAGALKNPHYPIGVAGFPSVLEKTNFLPNPRIFGPGDFGLPEASEAVAKDPRFVRLIQPSDWFANIYRPYCGEKMMSWFVGIDTKAWPDLSHHPKDIDFLVYDKIRWHRDTRVPAVLEQIRAVLDARGLRHHTLRYGGHHANEFRAMLSRSRALLFVCEHETQGLAYQEAMAANIPVLAWEEGVLVDPQMQRHAELAQKAGISAVPYFDDRCGMRFKIDEFETVCDAFLKKIEAFKPRAYVSGVLNMTRAGDSYLRAYTQLCSPALCKGE